MKFCSDQNFSQKKGDKTSVIFVSGYVHSTNSHYFILLLRTYMKTRGKESSHSELKTQMRVIVYDRYDSSIGNPDETSNDNLSRLCSLPDGHRRTHVRGWNPRTKRFVTRPISTSSQLWDFSFPQPPYYRVEGTENHSAKTSHKVSKGLPSVLLIRTNGCVTGE